jgi:hypothetical protein
MVKEFMWFIGVRLDPHLVYIYKYIDLQFYFLITYMKSYSFMHEFTVETILWFYDSCGLFFKI